MQQHFESQQNDHQNDESQEEEEEEEEEPQPQQNEAHDDTRQSDPQEQEAQHHPEVTPSTNMPQERETLPEECTKCLCLYKELERRPHALPCGHTFCSMCIATLQKDDHLFCPSCSADHHATSASDFPVNYDLENMIRRFKTLQTKEASQATATKIKQNKVTGLGRKLQSIIKEQKESMESLGEPLQQELNQLEQYRVRLSLSLAKHERLLEELDRVTQQHRKAMKLLMEEDLRVESFMEEGKKDQRNLNAAQDLLDCVTLAHEAYPIVDSADDSAVVVEKWLQQGKEEFPSGTAYSTSCRVLENTEAALQMVLQDEDKTEPVTSGHPNCTILEMLHKIHERSVELVKQHSLLGKFKKFPEDVPEYNNYFSFSKTTSEGDKTPSPSTFTFKFGSIDFDSETPIPKFEASTNPSSAIQTVRPRIKVVKTHRKF